MSDDADEPDEPRDPDVDWTRPVEITRPWMRTPLFRGLAFVILFVPVVLVVVIGHASAWVIVLAALGLAMLCFNDFVYKLGAWDRMLSYKNGDDVEQSDFAKAYSMGCGAVLWLAAFGAGLIYLTHH